MPKRSYEELVQGWINTQELVDSRARWLQAQAAWEALHEHGLRPAQFAADVGCSAQRIRDLARAYAAFPTEESRAKDLSFRHHVIAARAQDPEAALRAAVELQLSTRGLEEWIRDKRTEEAKRDVHLARKARLLRAVERFNEAERGYMVARLEIEEVAR